MAAPEGSLLTCRPSQVRRQDGEPGPTDIRPAVLWDLEPDSWYRTADDVTGHVMDNVRPGSIILLHVELKNRSENRAALRRMIPELRARGYRFVTLSEMLGRAAVAPSVSRAGESGVKP